MGFQDILKSITKKEWQIVIFLILLLTILTTGPYVYGYFNAPAGTIYNWTHSITRGDPYVYFSYINQIKDGNWLLKNYFTTEIQGARILNLFWLPVGLLARLVNLSAPIAFQLARVVLIPLLLVCLYIFISYFFADQKKRIWALLFVLFSSGIGAYFAQYYDKLYPTALNDITYKWPIDLWVSEANIFLSVSQTPHFIVSWILMLLFFLFMLLALDNNKYFYSLLAGLTGLYWFNFHPYYFPLVFLLIFVYCFVLFLKYKKTTVWLHFCLSLVISLPFVIYHYFLIKTDYAIAVRSTQNICLTPPLEFVIIGFGFLLVFALIGIIHLVKTNKLFNNDKYVFLLVWLIVGFALVYYPLAWQRRLLEGLQIPLVFFTVVAVFVLYEKFAAKFKNFTFKNYFLVYIALFMVLFGFSTFFNLTRDLFYYYNQNHNFYLPEEYQTAAYWLKDHNNRQQAVLAYEFSSYSLLGIANQPVYFGHGHETLYMEAKKAIVNDFFADKYSDQQAVEFLQTNNIGYLFYGNLEKYNSQYDPVSKKYWQPVFQQGSIVIYQLTMHN